MSSTSVVSIGLRLQAVLFFVIFSPTVFAVSSISGNVYDRQRNPLSNVDVELLDDYYQSKLRTMTDGSGRYQFTGLPDGRYTVRVRAFRYDLQDQEMPIEILTRNIRGGEGTGYFQQDFYLIPRKGGLAESELGIVFAQDVPAAARKAYESANRSLNAKKKDEAISYLNEAIKIFPTYYLALHRMGKELVLARNFTEAVPFLLKASDVNPKSATAFYYLGYSLYMLGRDFDNAAVTSLRNASTLAPSSVQVAYSLGLVCRRLGNYAEAEKSLLSAKKLAANPVPEIHKELAQLYADNLKKYDQAADELEAYMKAAKMEGTKAADTRRVIASLRRKANSTSN